MKKYETFNVLYTGDNEIDLEIWEQIILLLITYGETILLHSSTSISNEIPDTLRRIVLNTYNELIEQGLLLFWDYEYSIKKSSKKIKVIPNENIVNLYSSVNGQIESYDGNSGMGWHNKGIEVTSKIIQYRHELWNIGIAGLVNTQSLLYGTYVPKKGLIKPIYKYESINKRYSEQLFKQFHMPPIGFLTSEDILAIRKHSYSYRQELSKKIDERLLDVEPSDTEIKEDCIKIFNEYNEFIYGLAKSKSIDALGVDLTKDTTMSMLATLMPSFALLPYAEKLFSWLKSDRKNGFVLFATQAKKRAMERYSKIAEKQSLELCYRNKKF